MDGWIGFMARGLGGVILITILVIYTDFRTVKSSNHIQNGNEVSFVRMFWGIARVLLILLLYGT
jgi:hypothetical protein